MEIGEAAGRWDVTTDAGLADFYDAAFDPAYRCAIRLTAGARGPAEDLVQEAFAVLLAAIDRGDVDSAGIGLIVTTIRHRFLNAQRGADRERRRLRLVASPSGTHEDPHDVADGRGVDLSSLSERERAALIFRYVDDLPVGEVAELLDVSTRAAESLLQRAKRKARRSSTEEGR